MKKQQENAMVYCRVDLHEKSDEILNITKQEHEILNFCKNAGYNVVKVFTDFTTNKNKSQPELQNMKDFAKQSENQIDLAVCHGYDRIDRDFEKTLEIMIDFKNMSIDLLSMKLITNLKNNTNER